MRREWGWNLTVQGVRSWPIRTTLREGRRVGESGWAASARGDREGTRVHWNVLLCIRTSRVVAVGGWVAGLCRVVVVVVVFVLLL
jgi:hypothetical protein